MVGVCLKADSREPAFERLTSGSVVNFVPVQKSNSLVVKLRLKKSVYQN